MDIDLTSIIIGIAALSTFFVPVGLYQFSLKKKFKNAKKAFESVAQKYQLQIDQFEILRNGNVIGIDSEKKIVLHLKNGVDTLTELKHVVGCKYYNQQRKVTSDDGNPDVIHELGIQLTFQPRLNYNVKLLFFEGKEGSTHGDERIIINKWIGYIQTLLKKTADEVIQ